VVEQVVVVPRRLMASMVGDVSEVEKAPEKSSP
jgi:hypothetical protein